MIKKNYLIYSWSFETKFVEFLDLKLLAGKFLIDGFQEGEPLLPLIEEQRLKLEASPASLSKLLRVKMLLSDINNNRRRVQDLFHRIDDVEDSEEDSTSRINIR